ncbi:uncharacterized protein LOC135145226 [Zophobas morio]|uniref:uncharacterized protein LOC135145226 n=1 Tax=Zophobas morio TaxID=2755281 RepID=UPI003083686D
MDQAEVEIYIGQLKIRHRALVAGIEDDFILGMDLISRHGLTVDPVEKVLHLGNEEFILNQRCTESKPIRLIACQNVKVRGNAETIFPVRAEIKPGFALGIIQPPYTPKKNLMVASALINTENDIPVRVANVFPKPMIIKSGEVLVVCEPVTKLVHHNESLSDNQRAEMYLIRIKASPLLAVKHTLLQLGDCSGEINSRVLLITQMKKEKRNLAREFLQKHSGMFASGESSGRTNIVRHRINTEDAQPIRQASRRLPLVKQEEAEKLVRKMLDDGVIEDSNSPWSSPVVLVTKKDGSTKFYVDYRKLNDVTKKHSYPFPRIDDTLTTLSGSVWFSTLDLKSGCWQVGIPPEDKENIVFSAGSSLY